ncbi:Protein kinase domain-containing protein [Kluyveromyces marxianus]
MSTTPHRHTYYGGGSGTVTENAHHNSLNSSAHNHNGSRSGKRRQVTFGPYIIGPTLGEGEFGKVKLGWSKSGSDESKNVAIKLIRRDTIPKNSEKEIKIYREINALKHLSHPNIVTLEEVLQNSKYIGIVLQYASGGEFYKYIQKKRRLKEPAACRLFAQLISGVHYMHHKGLAHRDLKLENLLLDEHENLIITDFGFVNEFNSKNDLMKTSCGSPCYAAPELVVTTKDYEARKADVWSCGVILYAMLAGYLPWDDDPENPDGDDIAKLYNYITKTPLKFPEYINPVPRDILRRILVSNPAKRITVEMIEKHQWLHPHSLFLSLKPEDWDTKAKAEISNIFRPPPKQSSHSRYSRPQSNSSVSSSEKRNSLIMDSTLHPQPVPPQESQSHAIAKPSSPSSELRSSPVKRITHSRSNSAASLALQAVVDAEREYFYVSQNSLQSGSLGSSVEQQSSNVRVQTYSATRSTTHNNSTSLMNRNSIIVEVSPNKEFSIASSTSAIPTTKYTSSRESYLSSSPIRNPINSPKFLQSSFNSTSMQNGNKFGPTHQSRPRPTSYQPTSTSYVDTPISYYPQGHPISSTNEFSYSTRTINSNSNTADSINRNFSPNLIGKNTDSMNFQSDVIRRGSFSASKPSPSIDLNNVEGDLIKTAEEDHKNLKQQHRKSQRYSAVLSEGFGTVDEETEDSIPLVHPKQSSHAGSSYDLSKELGKMVIDESRNGDAAIPYSQLETPASQMAKQPSRHSSVPKEDVRLKKEKRFSLLSFYSYYNNSKTSVSSDSSSQTRKVSSTSQKMADRVSLKKANNNESRNASGSVNYYEASKPRVPSSSSSKNNHRHSMMPPKTTPLVDTTNKRSHRSSVMVSSMKETTESSRPSERENHDHREQSTAKKVFDFFKRRSMRL